MCSVDFISLVSQNIIKIWKLPFVNITIKILDAFLKIIIYS